ncbi:hypothetical protein KIW84_023180 [Lathyrus oleraceus]|uniref:Uncharacterized protein n=1 Tax=Pisum sativum TaxID=3888 RepID=A0A9D4YI67_PEA|nr:hypothetical protein KIW84_023180 [Pisum sativum]
MEFQEVSLYSFVSRVDVDFVSNFHKGYGPSPISVLDSTYSEDISVIYECEFYE